MKLAIQVSCFQPHNMLIGEGSSIILMDLGSVREANVKISSRFLHFVSILHHYAKHRCKY